MEDLHWADPTTLEFLDLLVDQIATAKIFALFTYRPDFNPRWRPRAYITSLMLHRLTREKSVQMIRHISDQKMLPPEVLEQILTKTDGIPLFVEELTKMVLESDLLKEKSNEYELTGSSLPAQIPVTLQDSLMARLDRLDSGKELVQLCAILGREFTSEILIAVLPGREHIIRQGLNQLVESELLYQRGMYPNATYVFKHALIQETAYQSMLKNTRRQYHLQIADILVKRFPDLTASQPEIIAHHYTEAGIGNLALSYWQQAGRRAMERFANLEAIAHLGMALEILAALPESAERDITELDLLLAIGPSLIAVKGYASAEVEQNYSKARRLCMQLGKKTQLFRVLWGLWGFYVVRANHREAQKAGEELLNLSHREQNTTYRIEAHLTLGGALFCLADFVPASKHLEQGADLYDRKVHHTQNSLFAVDLGVFCSAWAAHPLWHIGYPDRALKRSLQAVNLAEELRHPYSLVLALNYAAIVHQFRREPKEAYQFADKVIIVCNEQKFAYYLGWATIIKGWSLSELGNYAEGSDCIQKGLKILRDTGAKRSLPYYLCLLAEVNGKSGLINEGRKVLAEALKEGQTIKERWWEAELRRLEGSLIFQQSGTDNQKAEDRLILAHNIAHRQQSLMLELRTANSLCRLWQEQDRLDKARQLLPGVYNRFTEGFETLDLREARKILQEIA